MDYKNEFNESNGSFLLSFFGFRQFLTSVLGNANEKDDLFLVTSARLQSNFARRKIHERCVLDENFARAASVDGVSGDRKFVSGDFLHVCLVYFHLSWCRVSGRNQRDGMIFLLTIAALVLYACCAM